MAKKRLQPINELRAALRVLEEALRPAAHGGSYWPVRRYLDQRDVYHDNLNEHYVLHEVVVTALRLASARSRK